MSLGHDSANNSHRINTAYDEASGSNNYQYKLEIATDSAFSSQVTNSPFTNGFDIFDANVSYLYDAVSITGDTTYYVRVSISESTDGGST